MKIKVEQFDPKSGLYGQFFFPEQTFDSLNMAVIALNKCLPQHMGKKLRFIQELAVCDKGHFVLK